MNQKTICALCGMLEEEEIKEDKPCKKCQSDMEKGFLIIAVDFSKMDDPGKPVWTGNRWVLKRDSELIAKLFKQESIEKGAGYLDIEDARENGLPIIKMI